jgi:hypothetical protein
MSFTTLHHSQLAPPPPAAAADHADSYGYKPDARNTTELVSGQHKKMESLIAATTRRQITQHEFSCVTSWSGSTLLRPRLLMGRWTDEHG